MDYSELIKAIKDGKCVNLPECALRRERELGIKLIRIHQEMRDTASEREGSFLAQLTPKAVPARLGGSRLTIKLADPSRIMQFRRFHYLGAPNDRPLLLGHVYYAVRGVDGGEVYCTSICSEQDLIQELMRLLDEQDQELVERSILQELE